MAKETFSPDEPLPAFTFPVIDEAQKQALLERVEAVRARPGDAAGASLGAAPEVLAEPRPAAPDGPGRLSRARRMGRAAWARASVQARRSFAAACAVVDRNRSRLPARLRESLRNIPANVLVATVGLLMLCVFIVTVTVAVLRPRHHADESAEVVASAAPVAAPKDPVPDEIQRASKLGPAALQKLTEKYPRDSRAWLALAASSSAKGDHAAAVSAIDKALAVDPKAHEQSVASDVLALAIRKAPTANRALELLRSPMKTQGAAVVYDLSIDPDAPLQLRSSAESWVRSPAFKQQASEPDLELAGALRYATSCTARHDLLPTASEKGGPRTLAFLKVAKAPAGCGRKSHSDCFPCLRHDDALKNAISAIEVRLSH